MNMFTDILALTRFRLSVTVAFTALTGFILYRHALTVDSAYLFMGVLFLSAAASALNQYQEREFDAKMERTKSRPLVLERVSSRQAILIATIAGLGGFAFLGLGTTPLATVLGGFNLLWYNAVYVPLKRKTSSAFLIGTLVGALPPLIGFTAAGGDPWGRGILLSLFLLVWQIPHFLLITIQIGNEYERAGFPSLISSMPRDQLQRFAFAGILGCSAISLLFLLFHLIIGAVSVSLLVIGNLAFVSYFYFGLVRFQRALDFKTAFLVIYLFQGGTLLLLIQQSLRLDN